MKSILHRAIFTAVLAGASIIAGCAGCNSVAGTYADQGGSILLELKSGGAASMTFMNDTATCTYSVSGQQLTLDCKGDAGKTVFTIHDDGSLTGPPNSLFPVLRKRK